MGVAPVDILGTSLIDGFPDPEDQYLYGARSAAVFSVDDSGLQRVGETGSDFESSTAERIPDQFNATNDELGIDDRSGSKGPEPEGVAILDGKTPYAFVGLERIGGVMVLDLSDPSNPLTIDYVNTRDFRQDVAGDSAPEGIEIVPAAISTTGSPLVLVANEVSGTLAVFEFTAPDAADNQAGSDDRGGADDGRGGADDGRGGPKAPEVGLASETSDDRLLGEL